MKQFAPLCDTPEREAIRDAIRAICDRFDDVYWAEKDRTHSFPFEFAAAVAEGGWLGISMPVSYTHLDVYKRQHPPSATAAANSKGKLCVLSFSAQ